MLCLSDVRAVLAVAVIAGLTCACATPPRSSPGPAAEPTALPGSDQGAAGTSAPLTGADNSGGPTEEVPAYMACDPATLPFTLPPDATRCQHVDIITTYFTAASSEEVIQFQADSLGRAGWQRLDDGAISGMGQWVKDGAQLNFIAGPQAGLTAVQVQEVTAAP
jgi:hypothetical protein